jgi:nicotinate-nucleotide adenylyltransferase
MPRVQPSGPLAIFGGIFNPVHNGHLAVAGLAREFLGLQAIHLFPSGSPPHKSSGPIVEGRHRLAMLRLAVRGRKGFVVHDEEIRRGGTTYTIDTLTSLRQKYPRCTFYFVIGSDNLREIRTWRRFREVLALVTLCVAHRPGHALKIPSEISRAGTPIVQLPSPEWGVSSTMLRAYLKRGYRCAGLVPDSVSDYIFRHRLYR